MGIGMRAGALAALLISVALAAQAAELRVAAASDLSFALPEIARDFGRQSGDTVKLSFGSSGNLHAQITNGAPYDLFFSADVSYARRLEEAGLIEPGSLAIYAVGQLALWVPRTSRLDPDRIGLAVLADPSVRKVALANPAHAPYGRAALAALDYYKLTRRIEPKLVYGENVLQAAQFVQSGAADAGLVALAIALAPPMRESGRYWKVPDEAYPALEQAVVILKRARARGALGPAQAFLAWLKGEAGRNDLERRGFRIPGPQAKRP